MLMRWAGRYQVADHQCLPGDNMNILEQIKQAAFEDELNKLGMSYPKMQRAATKAWDKALTMQGPAAKRKFKQATSIMQGIEARAGEIK
jgi:hypothetical protein